MSKDYEKIYKKSLKTEVTPREVGRLLIKDMISKLIPRQAVCRDEKLSSLPRLVEPLIDSEIASLTESTTAPWIACYNGLFFLKERLLCMGAEATASLNNMGLTFVDLEYAIETNTINQALIGMRVSTFREIRQEIVERLAYWYAVGIYCDMLSRNLRIPHIKDIICCPSYPYCMQTAVYNFNRLLSHFLPTLKVNKYIAKMLEEQKAVYKDGKLLFKGKEAVELIEFDYDTKPALDFFYSTFSVEQTLSLEGLTHDINRIALAIFLPSNVNKGKEPIGGKICYTATMS